MTKRATLSWAKKQKLEFDYHRDIIINICQLSQHDYFWNIVNSGLEYITRLSGEYGEFEKTVVYTKGYFWPWFINQWNVANIEFVMQFEIEKVEEPIAAATRKAIYEHYIKFHSDRLNSVQTSKGYDLTISQLIKNQVYGKQASPSLSKVQDK